LRLKVSAITSLLPPRSHCILHSLLHRHRLHADQLVLHLIPEIRRTVFLIEVVIDGQAPRRLPVFSLLQRFQPFLLDLPDVDVLDGKLISGLSLQSGEDGVLRQVEDAGDEDAAVQDRGGVAEHVDDGDGDGRERRPAGEVVAGAVDSGFAIGDVESGWATHEPCYQI
jgi:hypothetical protein